MCVQWIFNISRYCFGQFGAHQYRKSQQHHIVLMELLMDIFLLESRTWSFRKDHNTSIKPSFFQDFAMVYIATAALNNFAYTKWCFSKCRRRIHLSTWPPLRVGPKIRLMAKRSISHPCQGFWKPIYLNCLQELFFISSKEYIAL